MTQQLKPNERMLDYLYQELGESDRAAFEAELHDDAELSKELASLQEVRKAFRELPHPQQSAESVARMTALLMQQAAQGRSEPRADAEPAPGEPGTEGKLLSFRPRGLRRLFAQPRSGIFAAAAAALFWVVWKSQSPPAPPALPPSSTLAFAPPAMPKPVTDTPDKTAELPPTFQGAAPADKADNSKVAAAGAAATAAAPLRGALASDDATLRPPIATVPIKEAFNEALKQPSSPSPSQRPSQEVSRGPTQLFATKSSAAHRALDQLAMLDKKAAEKSEAYADRRFAQPPPPPLETPPLAKPTPPPKVLLAQADNLDKDEAKKQDSGNLRAQMAQAQAHRKDRIVEELANQELGGMPAGGGAGAPAREPPASRYAQNPPGNKGAADEAQAAVAAPPAAADNQAYAQNNAASSTPAAAPPSFTQNYGNQSSPPSGYVQSNAPQAAQPAYAQNNGPRQVASNADAEATSGTGGVEELLRQGRCAEAQTALQRLEQSNPSAHGLSEARLHWQRACQPQNQLLNAAPPTQPMPLAAPAPAKNYEQNELPTVQMERDAPLRSVAQKSAPLRAKKAMPSKAAKSADTNATLAK
jgi:hypothetical protein